MAITQELLIFFVGQIVLAAAVWGAIRADIKNIHSRIKDLCAGLNSAHERIDNFILGSHKEK